MSYYKGQSNFRGKPQVSKTVITLVVTLISLALAFAFGLAFRHWFFGGTTEARGQAQALTQSSALPPSGASAVTATSTAEIGLLTQTVSGIEFTATNFRREGSRFKADVCFVLQDDSDTIIWKASLKYTQAEKEIELSDNYGFIGIELRSFPANGQQRVVTFGADGQKTVNWEPAIAGQMGRRCDTLYFEVPAEADLSNVSLIIHSIAARPREGQECDFYLNKVQKALDARGAGIKIQCAEKPDGSGVSVVSKPASMSQEDAEAIVSSDEFFTIKGPWTFASSVK